MKSRPGGLSLWLSNCTQQHANAAIMTAAAAVGGGVLIYVLAASLCAVYSVDTVIVAYNYRFFTQNPPSSKLLFLAEALKLLTASSLWLWELRRAKGQKTSDNDDTEQHKLLSGSWWPGLPMHSPRQQAGRSWWLALTAWGKAMLVFAVPAVCYFITNK